MKSVQVPDLLFRLGGVAAILSGLLMAAGFLLHPAGEDATFGTDPFWVPAHALIWAAYTLSLVAWIAIYLVQASRAGALGVSAVVVVVIGTSLASWIFSSDVTFVPVIAAVAPALFRKIYSGSHVAIGIASVLTWVLGNLLFADLDRPREGFLVVCRNRARDRNDRHSDRVPHADAGEGGRRRRLDRGVVAGVARL